MAQPSTIPSRRSGPGRPARPLLSRDVIIDAALALVDEEGAGALTMARLARRLGVQAASLYHHLPDKAAIWEGIRERVTAEMDWSGAGEGAWDRALEQWARSYRNAFLRHPNTVMPLFTSPVHSDVTYEMYEAIAARLHGDGWPVASLVPVISAVEYLICGSIIDHEALGDMFPDAGARGAPLLAASVAGQRSPAISADRGFEVALAGLLDGLEAELARLRQR